MSDSSKGRPPLDFRFLDLMIILLVVSSGVAILVIVSVPGDVPKLQILAGQVPDASVGHPYNLQLFAVGGAPPYRWRVSGAPDGIQLRSDGLMSGIPSKPGAYRVLPIVQDRSSAIATAELVLRVTDEGAASQPLHINSRALPAGYIGDRLRPRFCG
jgi:hypothetical protein